MPHSPETVTDRSWINTSNVCQRVMRADQAPTHRRREKRWWEPTSRRDVLVWELGGAQTLTVNYLENMAIGAAMSVSEPLSMIWSLGTSRPIQLTGCLRKCTASQFLAAQTQAYFAFCSESIFPFCLKSYFHVNMSRLPPTAQLCHYRDVQLHEGGLQETLVV